MPSYLGLPAAPELRLEGCTTNSIRLTVLAAYLLITARYCGARRCNSVRHPVSGTSTFKVPAENSSARVRSATVDPQVSGHASSGALEDRRNLELTTFSSAGAICSTGI